MIKNNPNRLRLLYGLLTGACLGIAGICLITACVSIYRQGEFTPQIVAERFSPIALPVYLSVALVIGGFLLDLLLPSQKEKLKAPRQTALILSRLQAKADLSACSQELQSAITAQVKTRSRLCTLRLWVLLACSAVSLVYALNGSNFHTSQINASMIRAMSVLGPCALLSFAVCVFVSIRTTSSMEQEIALLKQAPVLSPAPKAAAKATPSRKLPIKAVVLSLALALLVFGYFTGGTADVLTKAVNICTECVGLG